MNAVAEMDVITSVCSIDHTQPRYELKRKLCSKRSLFFTFDTPNGEQVVKLPKYKLDWIGRCCKLTLVCFCEGIRELVAAPLYWPIPTYSLTRAPTPRSKKG